MESFSNAIFPATVCKDLGQQLKTSSDIYHKSHIHSQGAIAHYCRMNGLNTGIMSCEIICNKTNCAVRVDVVPTLYK